MTAKPPQSPHSPNKKPGEPAPLIEVEIHSEEIIQLCDLAIQSFSHQKAFIRFEKKDLPLVIVGDLHGQFRDLRSILTRCGPPHKQRYLFLGDYVDRGIQGIEVATLLLALKCKYPSKVFMLRGNHEDGNTCMSYGFYDECVERYLHEDGGGDKVWLKFLSVFNWLPLAAVINSTILAMHSPPYGLMCDNPSCRPKPKEAPAGNTAGGAGLILGSLVSCIVQGPEISTTPEEAQNIDEQEGPDPDNEELVLTDNDEDVIIQINFIEPVPGIITDQLRSAVKFLVRHRPQIHRLQRIDFIYGGTLYRVFVTDCLPSPYAPTTRTPVHVSHILVSQQFVANLIQQGD
uniref:Serine/threonine-protein phosphatase n=1 Tax=Panagrolaimus sp. PS1159 TaxID=55785 RepID=A0AC35FS62_9BILA